MTFWGDQVAGGLSVLHEVVHSFGEGQGVTGMLLLSSSHLTWVQMMKFGSKNERICTENEELCI